MVTNDTSTDDDRLLLEGEVSRILQVPCATLRRWRNEHVHLPYVRIGRSVRYRKRDLDQFINSGVQDVVRRA